MSPAPRPPSAKTQARRDELRWRRQQAIVDVAIDLVTNEGHNALTMQRLAEELECGIASVYRLFPSRDALIAELQHQALDHLHGSWLLGLAHLDETLAKSDLDPPTRALARAVASAWFWVVAEDAHQHEVDLTRRLFIDRDIVVPDEQATKIMPAALRLIDQGRQCLDDAVGAGALKDGNAIERSILLVASITGVVQTAKFDRWDASLFDSRHFGRQAIRDHFLAWGADPDGLESVLAVADAETAAGRLAPLVERHPVR